MCRGNAGDTFQRLDAALCLLRFGGFGAEATHKIFKMRDLGLLLVVSLILLRDFFGAGALKIIIVTGIGVDGVVMHMRNTINTGI